ncbi:MAG TPA: extracellular solute-binding protein, partial [Ruminococcus sp.]|nr:extracellular solute-binding protein [Ruminococcus sp.]
MGGDDRHEATLNAIKLWEERHPEITIIPEYGGWDGWTEKVTSQLSGGTEPDIMQINYDWLITMS